MYGKISCNDYLFNRKGRKGMRKLNRGKNKIFHKGILTFLMIFLMMTTICTTVKAEVSNNNIVIPKTGDEGLVMVIAVLILSGGALLLEINKQKVESRE